MKGAGKFLILVAVITSLLLLYVDEQAALFRISYRIDAQSELLARKSEAYRRLKFEVEQLKAPYLLEERMKQLELDLTLPQEVRVIRSPQIPEPQLAGVSQTPGQTLSSGLGRFLGRMVDVAQAKTDS